MAKIPGIKGLEWHSREWPFELIQGIVATTAAALGLVNAYQNDKAPNAVVVMAAVLVIGIVIVSFIKVVKAHKRDKQLESKSHPRDLEGCLHVLHRLMQKNSTTVKLRLTVHRVTLNGQNEPVLEQVSPYVGLAEGGEVGRQFPIERGVIGLAVRTNETAIWSRENNDYDSFVRDLIKNWGYTKEEACKVSNERMAGVAIPISNDGRVIGVVYCDANEPKYFDDNQLNNIFHACAGIADYIEVRYPS